MRKTLTRGALIAFVSAMGFLGAGDVQIDGSGVSYTSPAASARMRQDPDDCKGLNREAYCLVSPQHP
jgi:hypothetical protein